MNRLVLLIAASVAGLVACSGTTPAEHDSSGLLIVPGGYRVARPAPGHQQHLMTGVLHVDGGVVDTGSKQVLCRDCHAIGDAGFSTPPPEICTSCHQDQQKQHHPFDGGVTSCLTCHPFMAKTVPARFEKWTCFECHEKPQGSHPAIQVHQAQCEACHKPHEQPFTQAAECTTCHEVKLSHGAKGTTLAEKCMNCHPHHSEASVASGQCVTCHTKDTMRAPARVSPQALFKPGHVGCGSCHVAHRFDAQVVKPCESCHRGQKVLAEWSHDRCTDCHRPHQAKSQAIDCTASCHQDEGVKHPKTDGKTCKGCHEVHAPGDRLAKTCVECHDKAPFTAKVVHAERLGCDDCHEHHDAKPTTDRECKSCHQTRYAEVSQVKVKAGSKEKGHTNCSGCHEGLPHEVAGPKKPCLSCHEKQKPPQQGHSECTKCHESHTGHLTKSCVACHEPPKLPTLHSIKEHQECEKCHAAHTPEPGQGPQTCKACHKALSKKEHPTPPTQCIGCHLFKVVTPGAAPPKP